MIRKAGRNVTRVRTELGGGGTTRQENVLLEQEDTSRFLVIRDICKFFPTLGHDFFLPPGKVLVHGTLTTDHVGD